MLQNVVHTYPLMHYIIIEWSWHRISLSHVTLAFQPCARFELHEPYPVNQATGTLKYRESENPVFISWR